MAALLTGPFAIPKVYNGTNKTFFMFNYEARKRRDGGIAQTANHPPTAFRNGDFSSLLALPTPIRIVDPLTGDPFAGNIIPANRISNSAKELMKFWPEPQRTNANPLVGINYTGFERRTLDDTQVFGRIDHNISENDKIFARYAFNDVTYRVIPGDNPNFTYFVAGRNQNVGTAWIHIFNPNLINEVRYGYNRSVDNTLNNRANTSFDVETLGLTGFRVVNDGNRKFTTRETGVPTISVNAFSTLAEQDGGNGFDFNNLHQFNDNLTWVHGSHSTKFGFDYRWVALYRGAANVPRGGLNFNGDIANNGFAAFLLGFPSVTTTPEGLPRTQTRQQRYAAYATDDWKLSRKLTLNYGVRWEYNTPAVDVEGLWRSLSFRCPGPMDSQLSCQTLGPSMSSTNRRRHSLCRDLALPYRPSDNWVIRGGLGVYNNVHQLNNYTILNLNPPKSGTSNFANSCDGWQDYQLGDPAGADLCRSVWSGQSNQRDWYQRPQSRQPAAEH
jgi:hypothetical protein